jgi:hypothetical protein
MDAQLIAFTGPAGAGKSEAARALLELSREGGLWRRVKFADILKAMLRTLYELNGVDYEDILHRLEGRLKELPDPILLGATPRTAMQTLGSEWGRDLIHPDLWVSTWENRVRSLLRAGFSVVVDDLRFPNEALAIRGLGGRIIEVRGRAKAVSTHHSESFRPNPDEIIENRSTLTELHRAAREIAGAN